MKKHVLIASVVIFAGAVAFAAHWYLNRGHYEPALFWQISDENNQASIDHTDWQTVLDDFLISDDPSGVNLVDYESLAEDSELLESYVNGMVSLDPRKYNRAEQFAYWVNLYNALTFKTIIDHYPVESITKISASGVSFGPWDDQATTIAGQAITLNDIEHRILRAFWNDHRIHFAVNCASIGCPNVQAEAFTALNTEELLQEAALEYLQHPRGLSFNNNGIVLSSIFKWYKQDFGNNEIEVLSTLSQYLTQEQQSQLTENAVNVSYDYDWSLNQAE